MRACTVYRHKEMWSCSPTFSWFCCLCLCFVVLKVSYHDIFRHILWVSDIYKYIKKTCLWCVLLKIPNRSCILDIPHIPLSALLEKRWLWVLSLKKKRGACARSEFYEIQLNAAVIKCHIMFQTTSRIISETVWSSNAFSLAGLPQGEFLFLFPAFLYILSPVQLSSEC